MEEVEKLFKSSTEEMEKLLTAKSVVGEPMVVDGYTIVPLLSLGYARVSTHDQNLNLQKDALKTAGCGKNLVDEISGAAVAKSGSERAPESLREEDVLAVWRLAWCMP